MLNRNSFVCFLFKSRFYVCFNKYALCVHIWGYDMKNDHTYVCEKNLVKCDWIRSFKISILFKIKYAVVHSVSKNISNKIKMVSTYQSWSVFEQFGASFFLQEWFISLDSIKWLHDIVIFIVFGWEHATQSFRIDRESSD